MRDDTHGCITSYQDFEFQTLLRQAPQARSAFKPFTSGGSALPNSCISGWTKHSSAGLDTRRGNLAGKVESLLGSAGARRAVSPCPCP